MLTRLTVENLALIEHTELTPCDNLNILSGETGAGKSIIVDGIMLLLGARYDKSLLRYGAEYGFVEGVFDITDNSRKIMEDYGIEDDDCVIIRRKFFADGKNEIRINGRSATIGMLKQLTASLVDIYGQGEYQTLIKPSEHLRILDYYIRILCETEKSQYAKAYHEYKNVISQLNQIGEAGEREREIDLLRFQISEINQVNTYESEESELIEKRNIITSAEKIYEALGQASQMLSGKEDGSASELVSSAQKELGNVSEFKNAYSELYERLSSIAIELDDIAENITDELGELNFDMNELDELERRLSIIRGIKRKYGDYRQMLAFKEKTEKRLEYLENADKHYEALNKEKDKLLKILYDIADELHEKRVVGAREFENKIKKELHELGMENAEFKIELSEFPQFEDFEDKFGINGTDMAEFYLSANAGQPLKPLIKIISGGEMSRFMLALKVITNESDDIPTMIFDEIDAGISGITGQVVAKKLAAISRKHQILCVTHLPQIASMADAHFYIKKQTVNGNTATAVTMLDVNGMIDEISRLSGGRGISEQSDINAQTIKKWCDEFKKTLN